MFRQAIAITFAVDWLIFVLCYPIVERHFEKVLSNLNILQHLHCNKIGVWDCLIHVGNFKIASKYIIIYHLFYYESDNDEQNFNHSLLIEDNRNHNLNLNIKLLEV